MSLTSDEVRHVARLARLALDDAQIGDMREQLSKILDYAAKVGEVAAEDVPPTSHAYELVNVLRADEPRPSLEQAEAVSTAPVPEDGRFRVPKIMGEEAAERPTVGGDRMGDEA